LLSQNFVCHSRHCGPLVNSHFNIVSFAASLTLAVTRRLHDTIGCTIGYRVNGV